MSTNTHPDHPVPSRYAHSRDHIRSYYGIQVKRGLLVIFDGQPGRITGLDGHHLLVRLDDTPETARPLRCHPTWRMAYPTLGIEATE